jgi:hypothetical protein
MVRTPCVVALLTSCGGSAVADDPPPCKPDPEVIDKQWLVGNVETTDDDPTFTATVELVGIRLAEGLPAPDFIREPRVLTVRFRIMEDDLTALLVDERGGDTSDALVKFSAFGHTENPCCRPDPEMGFSRCRTVPGMSSALFGPTGGSTGHPRASGSTLPLRQGIRKAPAMKRSRCRHPSTSSLRMMAISPPRQVSSSDGSRSTTAPPAASSTSPTSNRALPVRRSNFACATSSARTFRPDGGGSRAGGFRRRGRARVRRSGQRGDGIMPWANVIGLR